MNNLDKYNGELDGCGVIVCSHSATKQLPIIAAVRDEPIDALDTGWQFTCGGDHEHDAPQLWRLDELLQIEPAFRPLVNAPPGTIFTKDSADGGWRLWKESGEKSRTEEV
jgi:hypothetical protein